MPGIEVRMAAGSITLNAGTALPLSNHSSISDVDKILSLVLRNPTSNKGLIFIGVKGTTTSDGFSVPIGAETPAINFRLQPLVNGGYADPTKIYFVSEKTNDRAEFLAILDREG